MADLQRVNGNLISWGSLTFKLGNEVWTGVTEVTANDKRERSKGYGAGPHQGPRGRSRGKYTVDVVKCKMFADSAEDLRVKLAALAADGRSYGDVTFDGELQFAEANLPAQQWQLVGLVWVTDGISATEGSDAVMCDVEFDAMYIIKNGKTLFDSSQGFPSAG